MNTTVFLLLFCNLTAHCAIYKTQDEKLRRIIRSPHFTKSDSGDSSIVFRTQNWSGVARGSDGAQDVFSGAAAAAGSVAPAANEAFSIAASGAAPVKDKIKERFGGSDHSDLHYIHFNPPNFNNPYIPDHHADGHWGHGGYGHNFHRSFSGHQRGGYNYGQLHTGSNSQDFAKTAASSNSASGCDDVAQNGFVGNGHSNIDALSKSQGYSNAMGGFGGMTQNNKQFSSNTFSNSEATSFPLTSAQNNEGYSSGSYDNQGQLRQTLSGASNGNVQNTAESKKFTQSESLSSGVQQTKSSGQGFGNFQGLKHNDGQQVDSGGNAFSSSQGLQNGRFQQVESDGNGFISSLSLQNDGGQQLKSYGSDFSSAHGFHNAGGYNIEKQGYSKGFESDQSQIASNGFDHNSNNGHGSKLSKGFELGTGSTNGNTQFNYNKQDISSVSGSRNVGGGFTGYGQRHAYGRGFDSSKYHAGTQSEGLQTGGVSEQSSDSDQSLINSASSNGQKKLSSSFGASGSEDLESTLSGALGLASQGLQASQNQPCSTCQKSSYAFSNAKSHSGSAVALSIGG